MTGHELLLLRHAATEDFRPGHSDVDRRLTAEGAAQAAELGRLLTAGFTDGTLPRPGRVLCSPAVRTRQTADALGLGDPEIITELYQAAPETILAELALLDEHVPTALVIAHNPGVPGLVRDLVGPDVLAPVGHRYPPGTLARLRLAGPWADPAGARLIELIMPGRGRRAVGG